MNNITTTDFTSFVRDFIRSGGYAMNWLEKVKYEITPLFKSRLKYLLNGSTFIIITDDKRSWFEDYFLKNINSSSNYRPLLPFISMKSLGVLQDYVNNNDIDLLNDLLNMTFPNGYIYFYIGDGGNKINIAKSKDDSFIWLFDEQLSDSLYLSSDDKEVDIKLITLYMLFEACVDATIFSRVSL